MRDDPRHWPTEAGPWDDGQAYGPAFTRRRNLILTWVIMSTISHAKKRKRFAQLLSEAPTWVAILTLIVALVLRDSLCANLMNYPRTYGVFGVLRHADAVAEKLGEPSGTLVLTLSVIAIEVAMMSTIMLHGADNPTLARDAMFATLMIVLNGLVGFALLLGALRYWEQEYNLEGARAFLVVIACLSVFAFIIPNYTVTPPDPTSHRQRQNFSRSPAYFFMACFWSFRRFGIALSLLNPKNEDGLAIAVAFTSMGGGHSAITYACY